MPMEECSICLREYPHYRLAACFQCGRRCCKRCLMFDEEGHRICLRCARRRVSPSKLGTKYSPLSRYLAKRYGNQTTLRFAEIEGILKDNLPLSAIRYKHWWTNTASSGRTQASAWLDVGWIVQDVDLKKRMVTFRRKVIRKKIEPY